MSATIQPHGNFAERTERAVVRECVRGDVGAVAELYRRHHHRLIAYFVQRTKDLSLAEDLAHDAMLRFLGAVDRFDDSRPVWPYLKVTAHNVLVDHVRKAQRQIPVDAATAFEDEDELGPDFADQVVLQPLLRDAIARLPDRQQAAVELRYTRGWSLPDAADFLGVTTGALTQLLFRARQTMKAALEESGARLNGLIIPALIAVRWRARLAADRARLWGNSQPQAAAVTMDGVVSVLVAAGLTLSLVATATFDERVVEARAASNDRALYYERSPVEADAAPSSADEEPSRRLVAPRAEGTPADIGPAEAVRIGTPDTAPDAEVVLEESADEIVISNSNEVTIGSHTVGGGGRLVTIHCDAMPDPAICDPVAPEGTEEITAGR